MKLLTIVGARPQFIKAAMISKAIVENNRFDKLQSINEEIVHTGQHYDSNMSSVFFEQMGIAKPAVNLHVGSGAHGKMTGRMLELIESEILKRRPDWVLVYGDTNSTLAGTLAAAKLNVPVAHVESGLRSFNRRMPEEINRILSDHAANLLFCPTTTSVKNLANEGITSGVYHVGDVMYDAALYFGEIANQESDILRTLGVEPKSYFLATVHRAENTDDPDRLSEIMAALLELSNTMPVVFPVHPRTRHKLESAQQSVRRSSLKMLAPVPFLDMVMLEKYARVILTDSGGVQKEAYFQGVPCVTLRDETEWIETVDAGWNQIVGAKSDKIVNAVSTARTGRIIDEYGDGQCADKIISLVSGMKG